VSNADAYLYKPATTIRVRNDTDFDTPFPPEITHGDNPPDGAIITYYLKSAPSGPVTIGIYDAAGKLVRELTSVPPPPEPEPQLNVPNYWIERPHPLTAAAGGNRAVWDLRYTKPTPIGPYGTGAYPISALYGATPAEPRGPLVAPGTYEARLTVNGKTYKQTFQVTMDPRVKTPAQGISEQRDLGVKILDAMSVAYTANQQVADVRAALAAAGDAEAAKTLAGKVAGFGGAPAGRGGRGGGGGGGRGGAGGPTNNFTTIDGQFGSLMTTVEQADEPPTIGMRENFQDACKTLTDALTKWEELKKNDLPAVKVPAPAALTAPNCGK
jgi:hypothetical protein